MVLFLWIIAILMLFLSILSIRGILLGRRLSPIYRVLAVVLVLSGLLLALTALGVDIALRDTPSEPNKRWDHYRNVATVFAPLGTLVGVVIAGTSFVVMGLRTLMISEAERAIGTWSKLNEALLKEPLLTEVWLDKPDLDSFHSAAQIGDKSDYSVHNAAQGGTLEQLYRRRAIAGLIMDSYLKLFLLGSNWFFRFLTGESKLDIARNDNPNLIELWYDLNLRSDYEKYPRFQAFVEKHWFIRSAAQAGCSSGRK